MQVIQTLLMLLGTYTSSNIDGKLTTTKQSGDTFSIEVKETTDNAGTYSAANSTKVGPNMTAGYSAGEYSLTLGKWYFAEADTDTITIPGYSTDTIASRKITFIPDATAINGLGTGDVRYATITVKTMRSSTEIDSETFTVAIYKAMKPVFSIEAVTDSVNEGGTAQFKVTTNTDPDINVTHSAMFTPKNVKGTYLKTADVDTSKPVDLTFTADQAQNPTSWTSNTFDLELRTDNSTDEENGIITVSLDRASGSISSATFTTDPNNTALVTVKDLTVPTITFENATGIQAQADAVFTLTATNSYQKWVELGILCEYNSRVSSGGGGSFPPQNLGQLYRKVYKATPISWSSPPPPQNDSLWMKP